MQYQVFIGETMLCPKPKRVNVITVYNYESAHMNGKQSLRFLVPWFV